MRKPKLIAAAAAVTALAAAGVVIGAQAYGAGESAPPAAAPVQAELVGNAKPAEAKPAEADPIDAEGAVAEARGDESRDSATPPLDEGIDRMPEAPKQVAAPRVGRTSNKAVFLIADLNGRNEVPVAGGPAVGDKDGRAVQVVRIRGNQVAFATAFKNVAAPTANHIHAGVAGVNGAIKVDFFGTALPGGVSAVTGQVTVTDQALLNDLATNPQKFYANLHTGEFPGGAVRGQYRKLNRPVDLDRVFNFGKLFALGDGKQEVPVAGGPAVGDPDGRSVGFVWANNTRVDYSLRWNKIAPPTLGHIHQGKAGVNGAVVVDLFAAPTGLPASITGVAGTVTGLDRKLTNTLKQSPDGFYTNLHTGEFPGGAVRGQLKRA
jgi:CHRD domain